MGAAFLEYTLRSAIQARLREMKTKELEAVFDNHGHGALATFSQIQLGSRKTSCMMIPRRMLE
jgi:hypothetical protein